MAEQVHYDFVEIANKLGQSILSIAEANMRDAEHGLQRARALVESIRQETEASYREVTDLRGRLEAAGAALLDMSQRINGR